MASTGRLSKALKLLAPEEADKLNRAGREARDARRCEGDPDVDEAVTSHIAQTLRRQRREGPVRGLTIAQKAAERAANKVVADFKVTAAELAKIEAYHNDRVAELGAQVPNDGIDKLWDVRAESLGQGELDAALHEAAAETEAEARADWVKLTGGKKGLGLGFRGHGREEAGRDAPLEPNPEADAAALRQFHSAAEGGAISFMQPPETGPAQPLRRDNTPYATRGDRKDANAAAAAARAAGDDAADIDKKPTRVRRDKADTQPSPSRSRR